MSHRPSVRQRTDGLSVSRYCVWIYPHAGRTPLHLTTVEETNMNHHTEHRQGNKEKPESPKKVAPAKPVSPDPHAGHDMSKPMKPGIPQKSTVEVSAKPHRPC